MSQGNVRVEELAGARRTMTASLEPVFVPKRPATSGPLFAVDAPAESPAAGAKAVFSPKGESLGFLQPDKQLVVRPGYTADLTQPFPPKTVQLAMATIPSADSAIAMPVFDVNGGYQGYLAGPTFYAQAIGAQQPPAGQVQMAQAVGAGGAGAGAAGINPWYVAGGVLLLTGARHWWALLGRGVRPARTTRVEAGRRREGAVSARHSDRGGRPPTTRPPVRAGQVSSRSPRFLVAALPLTLVACGCVAQLPPRRPPRRLPPSPSAVLRARSGRLCAPTRETRGPIRRMRVSARRGSGTSPRRRLERPGDASSRPGSTRS